MQRKEELEVQGRKSQDDPLTSSVQGLVTPPTTKVHAPGEEQVEDISPNTLEAAKNSSKKELMLGANLFNAWRLVNDASVICFVVDAEKPTSDQDKGQREGKAPMITQRITEEEELNEQQKKRKSQVQFEAQHYTNEDWDLIRAKLEANAELSKSFAREVKHWRGLCKE
ncbi:hypothetical protein Tco_1493900 [Tanacetum coccineum]